MTDDEQRAIETLTSIAKVYKATSGIEDDGSEDAMTRALRRDLPIALAIIERYQAELEVLREVANVAEEYLRKGMVPTRDGPLATSLRKWIGVTKRD